METRQPPGLLLLLMVLLAALPAALVYNVSLQQRQECPACVCSHLDMTGPQQPVATTTTSSSSSSSSSSGLASSAGGPSGSERSGVPPTTPYPRVVPDLDSLTANVLPEVAQSVAKAGVGRKVIAVSLYGNNTRYTQGAVENAFLAQRDWPGWTYRVYHGAGVPAGVLAAIQLAGGELVSMAGSGASQGRVSSTFWRFLALTDPTLARVIFRDADSRLGQREKAAVEEWEQSGFLFHTMKDNRHHHTWPVLAGMFGAVNGLLHPRLVQAWFDQDATAAAAAAAVGRYRWYADQDWLRDTIWPLVKNHTLSHASFHCGRFGEAASRGFPTQRLTPFDFVGNVFEPKNRWQGERMDMSCSKECRRRPDWESC